MKEENIRINLKFIHRFREAVYFAFMLAKYASIM